MKQVKVGVIGAGRMGQRHCRVYSTLRQAQLVGICDIEPETGRRVAEEYDVPFYRDVDALLERVDAVSLTTPTPSHFDLAMRCLAHGVHVLVEKPITETVEQAEILTRAAEASNLVVQIGHIERFNPAYIELKNVLEDLTVLAIHFRRLSPYVGSNTDVDVVMDLMTHDVDLALDLMGREPLSINAYGLTAFSGYIDHAVAHMCFGSGPILTLTASRVTEQKVRFIEVTALEAYVEADLLNKSLSVHRRTVGEYLNHDRRGVKYRQESVVERIFVPTLEPLFLELQHFVDCILHGNPPQVSSRDGLKALRLVMDIRSAIYESLSVMTEEARHVRDAIGVPV
ncbi:MAG: Gfo/Idh/MocA family oxidoreductase [Thermoflexales bacterium]|nr:Gfo/Idh/MocA family oxidoreductase [Thermoflexales bacterium]